ncbi:hypothetical protein B4Q13_23405, partial [Lacticaseibacillus rhamnosus]
RRAELERRHGLAAEAVPGLAQAEQVEGGDQERREQQQAPAERVGTPDRVFRERGLHPPDDAAERLPVHEQRDQGQSPEARADHLGGAEAAGAEEDDERPVH